MMLNSRFELSKIEKNTRVEREICLATLENREWKENLFLPLSKIESRKRIVSCHSRKSRVEREMETIKFSRSREKFLFLLSIFLSRARLLSMPAWEVSGRLMGGHGRSPGGYKMLIANAIAEQRLYPSFFGSDILVKSESNEDQKSAYSRQSGFRDKNAYLFH